MSLLKELGLIRAKTVGAGAATRGAQPAASQASAPTAKGAPEFDNYAAFFNGINLLVTGWEHPKGKIDVSPSDDSDLLRKHRRLLGDLQRAIAQVKPAPVKALAGWEQVASGLRSEVAKSAAVGMTGAQVGGARAQLDYIEKNVFVPGAYYAAKREAEVNTELTSPDLSTMAPKLVKAEQELGEAKDLWEEAVKIGTSAGRGPSGATKSTAGGYGEGLGTVKEIIELVQLPGTIKEKLEEARKRGIATTAADLVAKVGGATGTVLKLVGETGEKFAEAQKAVVLARGATKATEKAAESLEKVAGKFKKLAEKAKSVGKAAGYAAVIADGVRLVSALRDGDYSEAASAAVDVVEDGAPLVLGDDLAGPLSIAIIAVKADIEAMKLAAAFIRYCKDEMVRQAALDFVNACDAIAKGGARSLVADCNLVINASSPKVQAIALDQANREAASVSQAIRALSSHVTTKAMDAIGGYPPVVAALGRQALTAMAVTYSAEDGALLVAQQIDNVFKGANAMAEYVKKTYTN